MKNILIFCLFFGLIMINFSCQKEDLPKPEKLDFKINGENFPVDNEFFADIHKEYTINADCIRDALGMKNDINHFSKNIPKVYVIENGVKRCLHRGPGDNVTYWEITKNTENYGYNSLHNAFNEFNKSIFVSSYDNIEFTFHEHGYYYLRMHTEKYPKKYYYLKINTGSNNNISFPQNILEGGVEISGEKILNGCNTKIELTINNSNFVFSNGDKVIEVPYNKAFFKLIPTFRVESEEYKEFNILFSVAGNILSFNKKIKLNEGKRIKIENLTLFEYHGVSYTVKTNEVAENHDWYISHYNPDWLLGTDQMPVQSPCGNIALTFGNKYRDIHKRDILLFEINNER